MRSSAVVLPVLILAAGLLGACAAKGPCLPGAVAAMAGPPPPDWHDIVTDPDHVRLRNWRTSFITALDQARKDGHGAEIDAAGVLLDPDAGLDDAALAQGQYHCRTIKLGSRDAGRSSYIVMPAYDCMVRPSGTIARLTQSEGLQRPTGRLYPDGPARMIFLGTMELSDEAAPIKYGRDNDRDLVGTIQRIGDGRWRLLLPTPAWESTMDVMELTSAD